MAERKQVCVHVDVNAVASERYIESLRRRLDVLEKKLLGNHGPKEGQPPLRSTLETINQKLSGLAKASQGQVALVWKKIDTLEKVLNPEYAGQLKLSEDAKVELFLNFAEQLKPLSERVEEIQKLKDYLNTTEFQGLESHEKKLAAVTNVHTQQEIQVEDLTQQVVDLTQVYHRIILQLSAQCVEWDEVLTKLESRR